MTSPATPHLRRRLTVPAVVLSVLLVAVGSWRALDPGDAASVTSVTPPPTPTTNQLRPPPKSQASPAPAGTQQARKPAPKPKRTSLQRATGLRADGSAFRVPRRGSGDFATADRRDRTSAKRGRLVRFDVAVEKDLDIDPDQAALLIADILDDERSWRDLGLGRFTLVPAGADADVRAYIATPETTDRLCRPYRTLGRVSCQNGAKVVLNAKRWVDGSPTYGEDRTAYRRYLVNHEFGHVLGRRHVACPGRGRLAPVMVQQTKGLGGCRANPWPARTKG